MENKINIVLSGLGPIGIRTIQYILNREDLNLVGAIDINPDLQGKLVSEIVNCETEQDLKVSGTIEEISNHHDIDVAVVTTSSDLIDLSTQSQIFLSHGINVVSSCEELAFPWITNPKVSQEMDQIAKENGVSVLGTGINPGFLMDTLPMMMTALSEKVEKVTIRRLQDASKRRIPFQTKIGANLTTEEFLKRVELKTLRHVGITESIHLIAQRLGWELDNVEDIINPVYATTPTESGLGLIEPGKAIGVLQVGKGYKNGEEKITLEFKATVGEEQPCDEIIIEGNPPIHTIVPGGINGDVGTCAIMVNAIPVVYRANPGLKTMADCEPVSYFDQLLDYNGNSASIRNKKVLL